MAYVDPSQARLNKLLNPSSSAFQTPVTGKDANIQQQEYANGKIKVYTDPSRRGEKIEMWPNDETKIVVFKETSSATHFSHYKEMHIMSADGEELATINLASDNNGLKPVYRFYDGNEYIGSGSGDFPYLIASKMFQAELDARLLQGADIDDAVIKFLSDHLRKSA